MQMRRLSGKARALSLSVGRRQENPVNASSLELRTTDTNENPSLRAV